LNHAYSNNSCNSMATIPFKIELGHPVINIIKEEAVIFHIESMSLN